MLLDVREEIKRTDVRELREPKSSMQIHPITFLVGPAAKAVEPSVRKARVVVESARRCARRELFFMKAISAALDEGRHRRCAVTRLGVEVDRTAERGTAVTKRVRPLVDLNRLRRQHLERFEICKAVGVAVRHSVDE